MQYGSIEILFCVFPTHLRNLLQNKIAHTKITLYVNHNFINFDCAHKDNGRKKECLINKVGNRKDIQVFKVNCDFDCQEKFFNVLLLMY
jgi:hypothetical protein